MYSIKVTNAGDDRSSVEQLLQREFYFSLGAVKLLMAGELFRSSCIGTIRRLEQELVEAGANTVVERYTTPFDESDESD